MTEDKMVGWHLRLDGQEFEQTLGAGDGQGGLACCSPWGHRESDTTERMKNNHPAGLCGLFPPASHVEVLSARTSEGAALGDRLLTQVVKMRSPGWASL